MRNSLRLLPIFRVGILPIAMVALHVRPGAAQVPQWIAVQDLRLGKERGADYAFAFLHKLAVGPRGEIVARRSEEQAVDIFDSTGARIRRLGHGGNGPGEFDQPSRVDWLDSGIWASDENAHRMSVFAPDGQLRSTRVFPHTGGRSPARAWSAVAGGNLVKSVLPEDYHKHNDDRLVLTDSGGNAIKELGRLIEGPADIPIAGPISLGYQPFDDRSIWTVFPGGKGVILVDRKVVKGRPHFRVRTFTPSGELRLDRTYDHVPVPISAPTVDSVIDVADYKFHNEAGLLGMTGSGQARSVPRSKWRADLYLPAYWPAVTGVAGGRDGTIWIRREDGRPQATWQALNERGDIIGQLALPPNVDISVGDRDQLWAIRTVEFGVDEIIRFKVRER
jgi:hypothetical protein